MVHNKWINQHSAKYVTPAMKRSVNTRNEAQREHAEYPKWDQKDDAFQDKRRTDADMNAVEEESSRANENARNGYVRSEDVIKESDKEDERT